MDRGNAALTARREVAQTFSLQHGIELRHKQTNAFATAAQIVEDWDRVRLHGSTHRGANARAYRNVALYSITDAAGRALLRTRVSGFIDDLYRNRPFAIRLEERIQSAIIDVRFNAAGVALYRDTPGSHYHPDVTRMWRALNDRGPDDYNVDTALTLFENIWKNRGTAYTNSGTGSASKCFERVLPR